MLCLVTVCLQSLTPHSVLNLSSTHWSCLITNSHNFLFSSSFIVSCSWQDNMTRSTAGLEVEAINSPLLENGSKAKQASSPTNVVTLPQLPLSARPAATRSVLKRTQARRISPCTCFLLLSSTERLSVYTAPPAVAAAILSRPGIRSMPHR